MNWIKVGNKYINLDRIVLVTDLARDKTVCVDDGSKTIMLVFDEADEFMAAFTKLLADKGMKV